MRVGSSRDERPARRLNPPEAASDSLIPAPKTRPDLNLSDLIPEARVIFDTVAGHSHDGSDSRQVEYANLLNRAHSMDDHAGTGTYADIASAGAVGVGTLPARVDHTHKGVFTVKKAGGSDIHGTIELAEGTNITLSQVANTITIDAAGGTHNLLSATHPDTDATGTPAQGDILYRNASGKWARLAVGTSTQALKGGSNPSWGAVAFSDLSGAISAAQHGAIAGATATHAMTGDVTGTTAVSVVEKIRGKNVPDPGAGEDQKFLRYNHGTTAMVWAQAAFSDLSGAISAAQHGAIAGSTATHAMTGDVTGTTAVSVVEKLRSVNLPAPVSGNNGQYVYYDHGAGAWAYGVPSGTGAPTNATYICSSSNGTLSAEKVLGTDVIMAGGAFFLPSVPGFDGRLYYSTDDHMPLTLSRGRLYMEIGGAWTPVAPPQYPEPTFLGAWSTANPSSASTSDPGTELNNAMFAGIALKSRRYFTRAGRLRFSEIFLEADLAAGASTATINVYKNGSAWFAHTITFSAGTELNDNEDIEASGLGYTWAAGDYIQVYVKRSGTLAANGIGVMLYGTYDDWDYS